LNRLWKHHQSQKEDGLSTLQVASECADHFLAGIDTTSDTLMFLIWALSLPVNSQFQERLRNELLQLPAESLNEHGFPRSDASDGCTFLNAVIKESLRLYAPLPSTEPRSMDSDSVVDGYSIPANTVVGMAPWTLHRNAEIFQDPLQFNPDRWLGPDAAELNRWFWAFSSGGRMCIGMQ
jgi:cytochrome P450